MLKGPVTHGHSIHGCASETLHTYRNMLNRCYNSNVDRFINYGGRGIKVCDDWRRGFEFFLRDMGVKPTGMSLERIDVNGDYTKMNCCWVGKGMQQKNKTTTIRVNYNGESMCLREAADRAGLKYLTVYMRYTREGVTENIFRPLDRKAPGSGNRGGWVRHNSSTT